MVYVGIHVLRCKKNKLDIRFWVISNNFNVSYTTKELMNKDILILYASLCGP